MSKRRGAPQQGDRPVSIEHNGQSYHGSFSQEHGILAVWATGRDAVIVGPITERFQGTSPQAELRAKRILREYVEAQP